MARNLAGEFNLLRPQETNDENVSQWLIVARKKAERAVESAAAASAADSSAASIEKAFQEVTLSSHS